MLLYSNCTVVKNSIETQIHKRAITQFVLHSIKSGKIDKRFGKLFTKLFDLRQKGDYGDLFDFYIKVVEPLIEQVKEFIEEINNHLPLTCGHKQCWHFARGIIPQLGKTYYTLITSRIATSTAHTANRWLLLKKTRSYSVNFIK